jgi:hypothetical protein
MHFSVLEAISLQDHQTKIIMVWFWWGHSFPNNLHMIVKVLSGVAFTEILIPFMKTPPL